MFKKLILYPFLLILDILLIPLSVNLEQIDPGQALRPLLILLVFCGALMALLYLFLRDWHYAGYLVFLFLVFQFVFGHLWRSVQEFIPSPEVTRWVLMGIWGILLVLLGLPRTWKRMGGAGKVTPFLNLVVGVLLLTQVVLNLPKLLRESAPLAAGSASIQLAGDKEALKIDCSQRPDIYYIILDAYGRSDVLQEYYGVDNAAFLRSLRDKGFYVADAAHTNYIQTVFSVPAALDMEFIKPNPPDERGADYFTQLVAENKITRLLDECGYLTIAFETGFSFTNSSIVDLRLSRGTGLQELEELVLADTPLGLLASKTNWFKPGQGYPAHRERVLFAFEQLGKLAGRPGPKFIFAHILSPHPPFVFDAEGQPIDPPRSYTVHDGDDFKGSTTEYVQGYAGQVPFVNRMLERTIDEILSKSPEPPIIIIQGDHGPGGSLDWHSPDKSCLAERSAILNAYYLPGASPDALYPEITPVNSFRVVLNQYFGADLEMLPDVTFFTSHRLPRQVIDINDERDSTANCVPVGAAGR
jgi:hypothetical protein